MYDCMLFETYLLSIINETYFSLNYNKDKLLISAIEKLEEKMKKFHNGNYTFKFAEFGTRRRLSREWQKVVFGFLNKTNNCVGTSNVYLSSLYGTKPIGASAHEVIQIYQAIDYSPIEFSNFYAMKDWYKEYNGNFGIALSDTLTTDLFLKDFDMQMSSIYNGVRNDSGDPYIWGEKIINHYKQLGIDPKKKTLLFSNNLTFDEAQKIYDYFKDKINVSFGIGTFCTNDTFVAPLNIVIKLQYVNDKPVAKLGDNYEKVMCQDRQYLEKIIQLVNSNLNWH